MSTPARPYVAFGKKIEQWRQEKFETAKSLFKGEARASFSYGVYSAFERGETLPTAGQAIEIARLLGRDPKKLLLDWLETQIPESEDEVRHFVQDWAERQPAEAAPSNEPLRRAVPEASADNTWVLGPGDISRLSKEPWLWDLCNRMLLIHPGRVKYADIRLPKGLTRAALLKRHLGPWIATGHVAADQEGVGVSLPYLKLPATEAALKLRITNMRRALDALSTPEASRAVAEGQAYRKVFFANLSEARARSWVEKLKVLEKELYRDAGLDEPGRRPHALLFGMGPWGQ